MWAVLTDREKAGGALDAGRLPGHRRRGDRRRCWRRLAELGVDPGARPRRRLRLRRRAADPRPRAGRVRRGGRPRHLADDAREGPRDRRPRPRADFRLATGPELDGRSSPPRPTSSTPAASSSTCRPSSRTATSGSSTGSSGPAGYVVFQMPTAPARNAAGLALRALPAPLARRLRARHGDARDAGGRGPRPGRRVRGAGASPPTRTPAPVRAGARASTSPAPPRPEQGVSGATDRVMIGR